MNRISLKLEYALSTTSLILKTFNLAVTINFPAESQNKLSTAVGNIFTDMSRQVSYFINS